MFDLIEREFIDGQSIAQDSPVFSFDIKFVNMDDSGQSFWAHSCFLKVRSQLMSKFLARFVLKEEWNEINLDGALFPLIYAHVGQLYSRNLARNLRNNFEIYEKLKQLVEESERMWEGPSDYNSKFMQDVNRLLTSVQDSDYGDGVKEDSENINDVPSEIYLPMKSPKPVSVLYITIQDPTNGMEKTFRVHKLFMKRSPHIMSILNSGMLESQTGHLTFNTISIDGFQTVLQYLYTNICSPTLKNAVEIYLFSCLLELYELKVKARKIIEKSVVSDQMAQDLLSIPEFRNDNMMRLVCVNVLRKKLTIENAFPLALNLDIVDLEDRNFMTRLASLLADQYDSLKEDNKYYDLHLQIRENIQKQLKHKLKKI